MTQKETRRDTLSTRQKRAVLALVEHGSVSKAADACKVARPTLYRWMREPLFSQALNEASTSQLGEASRRLDALLMSAIDILEMCLYSGTMAQRRRAVETVLSHAVRLRELTALEERIVALEQRSKAR